MTVISRTPRDSVEDPAQADDPLATRRHEIVTLRDGAEGRYPNPASQVLEIGRLVPVDDLRNDLDEVAVAQMACTSMLQGLQFRRMDLTAFMETGTAPSSTFEMKTILYDWPRSEDEMELPAMLVQQTDEETTYGPEGMETQLLEDTLDRYGDQTVLRKLGTAAVPLLITIWNAHKEERRAVRAKFVRSTMAEPEDQRWARRIVVPRYFDRVVILELLGTSQDDNSDEAQQNHWVLGLRMVARVEVVQLVQPPPLMQPQTQLRL